MIKSRRLKWSGHVVRMEEGRSVFKILIRKSTGKRPLGRLRHRWENNIRMDLKEICINTIIIIIIISLNYEARRLNVAFTRALQ